MISISIISFLNYQNKLDNISNDERLALETTSDLFELEISQPLRHLDSVVNKELQPYHVFDHPEQANNQQLYQTFYSILTRNQHYYQIRWLDNNGHELMRMQKNADQKISQTVAHELQNKANRYYFLKTIKQPANTYYISPIDLNIENGAIELPHNPVVRFATPVFNSDGRRSGIIVLNISFKSILANLNKYRKLANVDLINQDGYWLQTQDHSKEWAFMFNQPISFKSEYPAVWRQMQQNLVQDAFSYSYNKQLWHWKKIGLSTFNYQVASNEHWFVVTKVDTLDIFKQSLVPVAYIFLLFLIVFIFLVRNFVQLKNELLARKAAEESLQRQNATVEAINHHLVKEITERKAAQQHLEAVNADLDQFAYLASHDLKTPIRGITAIAQWIKEDIAENKTDTLDQHIHLLLKRVNRLDNLLASLIAYYRVGRKDNTIETVDTTVLINEIWEYLGYAKQHKLIIASDLPVFSTHKAPFEHVLSNLINNAVKHCDQPICEVAIDYVDQNAFYTFYISDNGPGIPTQFHTKVFEMFQTLKPKDTVEGSGMGLAIVKKTIQNMGGIIEVQNNTNVGVTVIFTWPKVIQNSH